VGESTPEVSFSRFQTVSIRSTVEFERLISALRSPPLLTSVCFETVFVGVKLLPQIHNEDLVEFSAQQMSQAISA
jgi:hypothetical protein